MKVTIDRAGRLVLPKPLRAKLHVEPGDTLELECENDAITLRPIRPKPALTKEYGIWVYQGEPCEASIAELIDREREKRLRELLG